MTRGIPKSNDVLARRKALTNLYHSSKFFASPNKPLDPVPSLLNFDHPRPADLAELAYTRRQLAQYSLYPFYYDQQRVSAYYQRRLQQGQQGGGTATVLPSAAPSRLGSKLDALPNSHATTLFGSSDSAMSIEASWKSAWHNGAEPPLKTRVRKLTEGLFGTSAGNNAGWDHVEQFGEKVLNEKKREHESNSNGAPTDRTKKDVFEQAFDTGKT